MNFFEMQQFIAADKSIIDYILRKVEGKPKRFHKRSQLHLEREKVYIVVEGVFIRQSGSRRKTGVEFLDDRTVLFTYFYRAKEVEIVALTTCKVIELDANTVIDILEEGELLAALMVYILERRLLNSYYFERQFAFSPRERINMFLSRIAEEFGTATKLGIRLPRFLTVRMVASYCCCSRGIVTEVFRSLRSQGTLLVQGNNWYLQELNDFQQATDKQNQRQLSPIL